MRKNGGNTNEEAVIYLSFEYLEKEGLLPENYYETYYKHISPFRDYDTETGYFKTSELNRQWEQALKTSDATCFLKQAYRDGLIKRAGLMAAYEEGIISKEVLENFGLRAW